MLTPQTKRKLRTELDDDSRQKILRLEARFRAKYPVEKVRQLWDSAHLSDGQEKHYSTLGIIGKLRLLIIRLKVLNYVWCKMNLESKVAFILSNSGYKNNRSRIFRRLHGQMIYLHGIRTLLEMRRKHYQELRR